MMRKEIVILSLSAVLTYGLSAQEEDWIDAYDFEEVRDTFHTGIMPGPAPSGARRLPPPPPPVVVSTQDIAEPTNAFIEEPFLEFEPLVTPEEFTPTSVDEGIIVVSDNDDLDMPLIIVESELTTPPQGEVFQMVTSTPALLHAQRLEKANQPVQALAAYNRAVILAAEQNEQAQLESVLARASFHLRQHNIKQAEADYRRAMELVAIEQRQSLAHQIALELSRAGFWAESLPWYSRRLALARMNPQAYVDRAYAYTKLNQYRLALMDYDAALALRPQAELEAQIHFQKAQLYDALGMVNQAEASFVQAPRDTTSLRVRADFYRRQGQHDLVTALLQEQVRDVPVTASDFAMRAEYHAAAGNYEEARHDFNRAIAISSQEPSLFARRAHFHVARGQYDLALRDYNHAAALAPDAAYRYADRARLLVQMGRFNEAIVDLSYAIDLEPTRAFRYNERALVWKQMERLDNANDDFARALQLDPSNITAQQGLVGLR